MARITKSLAEEITIKLVQKLDIEIKNIEIQIKEILYDEAIKQVPPNIMELFNVNKNYIKHDNGHYLNFGSYHVWYALAKSFPIKNDSSIVIEDKEICDKLEVLKNKQVKAIKKYAELYQETLNIILQLNTTSKIKEYFPEAAEFLPGEKMEIAINIQDTRNKINSL